MGRDQDSARLDALAQLTLDHRLGKMQAATAALDRSKAQLAALATAGGPEDLPLVAGAMAEWHYQRWADLRKSELNLVIARQTADWLTTRDEAKRAFGRLQALRAAMARIGKR
jgi:hypothetical protein